MRDLPAGTVTFRAGVDVHRGARICAAAHGGQVVLFERTAAMLDDGELRRWRSWP